MSETFEGNIEDRLVDEETLTRNSQSPAMLSLTSRNVAFVADRTDNQHLLEPSLSLPGRQSLTFLKSDGNQRVTLP